MEQLPILRRQARPQDLPALFKRAFERELERITMAQFLEPARVQHRELNKHYARYFTLLAEQPHLLDGSEESEQQFQNLGLAETDAAGLTALSHTHRHRVPVTPGSIADDLRAVGIEPTEINMLAVARVTAAAYREANIAACEELGQPMEPDEVWPLSDSLAKLARQVAGAKAPTASKFLLDNAPSLPAISIPSTLAAPSPCPIPQVPEPPGPLISELATTALENRISDGTWRKERRRDVEAAVALFIAANGDVPVNKITQSHLIAMKDLFVRLPREYGRERKDANGNKVRETIPEALARGEKLLPEWKSDPSAADAKNLPYVGLCLITQKKHLTWISSLFTYIEGIDPTLAPIGLNFRAVRKACVQPPYQGARHSIKNGKKKNSNRLPWEPSEIAKLFEAPVWQGCLNLTHKLVPGDHIYHDGDYFALPLITTTMARSNEICGLAVDDVFLDCRDPYIWIRPNGLRALKNDQSERKVPIAKRILELGFAGYVAAMRAAGHKAVFPEYQHATMKFETVFRKNLFDPLRAYCFPQGTSRKRGRKDVDTHSVRAFGINEAEDHFEKTRDPAFDEKHRKGLGGHEQQGTDGKVYENDFEPH